MTPHLVPALEPFAPLGGLVPLLPSQDSLVT